MTATITETDPAMSRINERTSTSPAKNSSDVLWSVTSTSARMVILSSVLSSQVLWPIISISVRLNDSSELKLIDAFGPRVEGLKKVMTDSVLFVNL